MLIPVEELKLLYSRAIKEVAWEEARPLPHTNRYQAGLVFTREGREYCLTFDAAATPEIMQLQTALPFARSPRDGQASLRMAMRLNAETPGVKFYLFDAPTPLLVCAVEAILASHQRIPNSEVVEVVMRNAIQRLEDAVEGVERELRGGAAGY
jgi:hypothetical protein